MKAKLISLIACSECGNAFYGTEYGLICKTDDCSQYGVIYEYPTIYLKKYDKIQDGNRKTKSTRNQ